MIIHFHTTGMRNHSQLLRVGLVFAEGEARSWTFPFIGTAGEDDQKAFAYCGYNAPKVPDDPADAGAFIRSKIDDGMLPHLCGAFGLRFLAKTGALDGLDRLSYFDISAAQKAYGKSIGFTRGGIAGLAGFLDEHYDTRDILCQVRFMYKLAVSAPAGNYVVDVPDLPEVVNKAKCADGAGS